MKVKIMLDEGAKMPTKAHEDDAGFDIYSTMRTWCYPGNSIIIDTGVHVQIPHGYVGMLKSKSGLNVKYGITSEGVIDSGYTGSIVAKLYNFGDETVYSELVKALLETKPECRNSDTVLYKEVLQVVEFATGADILSLSVEHFLDCIKLYGCPNFETVRRARQKAQEQHPELRAAQAVETVRRHNESVMHEWAKDG